MRQRNKDTIQYNDWTATRRAKGVYYARKTSWHKSKSYSLHTTSKEVAKRELIRITNEEMDLHPEFSCGALIDDWFAYMVNRGGNVKGHQSVCRRLSKFFGKIPATDFTTPEGYRHLDEYKTERLEQGISLTTLSKEVNTLSAVLNYARKGLDDFLKLPKKAKLTGTLIVFSNYSEDNIRDFVLTEEQSLQLVESCSKIKRFGLPNTQIQQALELGIIIGLTMSARLSSILDLTWDRVNDFSIDFRNPDLKGKRKKRPHNAIPPQVRPYLDRAKLNARTPYVIEAFGKKMTKSNFSSYFRQVRDICGFYDKSVPKYKRFTFHSLRHTCLTNLRKGSMPISKVSDWAGHSSTDITERVYTHSSPSYQNEEAKIAGSFLNRKSLFGHNREQNESNHFADTMVKKG